jgi:hypothetical protein
VAAIVQLVKDKLAVAETVLVQDSHHAGALVAVKTPTGWAVRRINDGEHTVGVGGDRRREHVCQAYPGKCTATPTGCGEPARFYPCGWRCVAHRPDAARPLISFRT